MEYNVSDNFFENRSSPEVCFRHVEECQRAAEFVLGVIQAHQANKVIIDDTISSMSDASAAALEMKSKFEAGAYYDDECKYVENLDNYSKRADEIREQLNSMSLEIGQVIENLNHFYHLLIVMAEKWQANSGVKVLNWDEE